MTFKIIGIAGLARSGKDTAANHIIHHRPVYQKVSFADPIKAMLRVGFDLSEPQVYGDEIREQIDERYGCTPRHMMQTLGTEWGRNCIDQDIWVKVMKAHLEKIGGTFVIPDIRFDNEADLVREYGHMIHIKGRDTGIDTTHTSEHGVDILGKDFLVYNTSVLSEYKFQIDRVLTAIEQDW